MVPERVRVPVPFLVRLEELWMEPLNVLERLFEPMISAVPGFENVPAPVNAPAVSVKPELPSILPSKLSVAELPVKL